jgi:hypothetical protein
MRLRRGIWVGIIVATLSVARPGTAQEAGGGSQGQAGTVPGSGPAGQAAEQGQATSSSTDSRSFMGAEEFSPGRVGLTHSYVLPSLIISEMADSNFRLGSGKQSFETINTVVGRLTLGKAGRHSTISLDYRGGAQIYNHRSDLNASMHQFGITGSYQGRQWGFMLDDRASYLPEGNFGYGGFGYSGGLGMSLGGASGSNLASLNPAFGTSGALFTGRGSQIMNTSVAQVQYATSARSSISVAGSYSLLHFRSPGFIDTNSSTFFVSFSHAVTARDFVGMEYGLSLFKLQNSVPAFQSHVFQFTYGHQISGRLALQVGAGPLINKFTNPVTGSTAPLSWTAVSTLQYRARRGSLDLSYSHYTTAGGGILAGAETDRVYSSWSVRLSRNWTGSLGPGYAHNRSLPQTSLANTKSKYDSFYARASLSRNFGRYATMFLSYNYETQRSDLTPCLAGDCRKSVLRHLVSFGFDFHPRQLVFD